MNDFDDIQSEDVCEGEHDMEEIFEDDRQPDTYTEYQDLYGGDDWDFGQYDQDY